jgi:hypothetical protein
VKYLNRTQGICCLYPGVPGQAAFKFSLTVIHGFEGYPLPSQEGRQGRGQISSAGPGFQDSPDAQEMAEPAQSQD